MQYKWLPRLLIISELLNIISKIWTRLLHKSFKFPLRVIHHNVSGAESYFFCYFIIITSWNDFYSLSRFFSRYCQEVFWCLKNDWNLFWIFFFLKNSNIKKNWPVGPKLPQKSEMLSFILIFTRHIVQHDVISTVELLNKNWT